MVATLTAPRRGNAALPHFAGCLAGRLTRAGTSEATHTLETRLHHHFSHGQLEEVPACTSAALQRAVNPT